MEIASCPSPSPHNPAQEVIGGRGKGYGQRAGGARLAKADVGKGIQIAPDHRPGLETLSMHAFQATGHQYIHKSLDQVLGTLQEMFFLFSTFSLIFVSLPIFFVPQIFLLYHCYTVSKLWPMNMFSYSLSPIVSCPICKKKMSYVRAGTVPFIYVIPAPCTVHRCTGQR